MQSGRTLIAPSGRNKKTECRDRYPRRVNADFNFSRSAELNLPAVGVAISAHVLIGASVFATVRAARSAQAGCSLSSEHVRAADRRASAADSASLRSGRRRCGAGAGRAAPWRRRDGRTSQNDTIVRLGQVITVTDSRHSARPVVYSFAGAIGTRSAFVGVALPTGFQSGFLMDMASRRPWQLAHRASACAR